MQSCFNLFYMPAAWAGLFAFEKQVPASAFGGSPHEMVYVHMRSVPMGWVGAVDVMQCMARRFVFGRCEVAPSTELRKDESVPEGDISVVCMDGFDFFRRLRVFRDGIDQESLSREHGRFVAACAAIGLPLNAGKRLVRGLSAQMLGGELDGVRGVLGLAREKGHRLIAKSLCLVSGGCWSRAALQHWAGHLCFAANFRRPVYSVMQEVFTIISDETYTSEVPSALRPAVLDEVLFSFT